MNITVVGAGYVGLANALMLGISERVFLFDIDKTKINLLKKKESPINDKYINKYLQDTKVEFVEIPDYRNSELIVVATNTNYDEETNSFNVNSIESVLKDIASQKSEGIILIKSTIPIGYTEKLKNEYPQFKFIFSPEFLREGYALYDNLYPDRIVIGDKTVLGKVVGELLSKNICKDDVPILYMSSKEAETVKLFANTYLATRVTFVNELDTYCRSCGLETKSILDAIGADHRIGNHYFNPSFGYGGYCLPKDSKQLRYEYEKEGIKSSLIKNVVVANEERKNFIADEIMKFVADEKVIGFYRIISKKGINNFRSSSTLDIINILLEKGVEIIIYEPLLNDDNSYNIEKNLEKFKSKVDVVVANRISDEIKNCNVFTTDVYNEY